MIISRAPTRITLGGGGTDLKSYYSKRGGFLIAAGINKYYNIVANKRFYKGLRLSYSKTEIKDTAAEVEHRIFRAALLQLGINDGIELHSISDVPGNSGLGGSSSFTVALMNALHSYRREFISQKDLAEEACHIEIDVLGEPIGKQDQYMAAFGGLTCLTFEKNGDVLVEPLQIPRISVHDLENNLILFFTGKERSASDILAEQDKKSKEDDSAMIKNLDQIKEIGLATRKYLESGQLDMLGELFHNHWETKKKRSKQISDPFIDECYEVARKNGALGGKLVGAGGGGFFLFYSSGKDKRKLFDAMEKMGLKWEPFSFDFSGARIIFNSTGEHNGK